MGAISVKYLFSQIPNNVIRNLRSLPLNNKPNELCHRFSHVILVIKEIYDFLNIRTLHVSDILAVFIHANMKYVEQSLF